MNNNSTPFITLVNPNVLANVHDTKGLNIAPRLTRMAKILEETHPQAYLEGPFVGCRRGVEDATSMLTPIFIHQYLAIKAQHDLNVTAGCNKPRTAKTINAWGTLSHTGHDSKMLAWDVTIGTTTACVIYQNYALTCDLPQPDKDAHIGVISEIFNGADLILFTFIERTLWSMKGHEQTYSYAQQFDTHADALSNYYKLMCLLDESTTLEQAKMLCHLDGLRFASQTEVQTTLLSATVM